MLRRLICAVALLATSSAHAELLGAEWISEADMKLQSNFARKHNLLLADLKCKFREDVETPGRDDVLFRADFSAPGQPIPWGWTFEANAPNLNGEKRAREAGFVIASEDYYEITGVTWVKCRVWRQPPPQ